MANLERLEQKVYESGVMRELYNHPGFKILKEAIEAKITDAKHDWLKADKEKAEEIRLKTRAYQDVYDLITGKILQGEVAKQTLKNIAEESDL